MQLHQCHARYRARCVPHNLLHCKQICSSSLTDAAIALTTSPVASSAVHLPVETEMVLTFNGDPAIIILVDREKVCGCVGICPPVFSVKSEAPLMRAQKKRWRVACVAGADSLSEWRRECGELRVQVHELRGALADAWMRDEILLVELEILVASLAVRAPVRARDGAVSVTSPVIVKIEDEDAKPDHEGEDEVYKDALMVSELRSEEIRSKQEGLSTMRRLKTLNVHEYVHNALRESHLRSWLKSRGIAE